MEQEILNESEARPYPNEHSCRLKPPNYKKYSRKNCYKKHDGKCIDFVFGIIGPDESELQSMRYPTKTWDESSARAHCKEHDGTFEPAKKEKESLEEPERRYMPFDQEMRVTEEEDKMIIEGYPIVYNVYAPIWHFREIIRKGAATKALKTADEIVLWDHESSKPMARRSNKTLEVKEDDHGVFIRADVSKTVWGRDGYEAIKNKVINKMSFAFDVNRDGEKWHDDLIEGVKIPTREIIEFAHLYDYSPVSYPAYKQTTVNARGLELALRHKPEPETSGEGSAAALEDAAKTSAGIAQMRIKRSFYLKEKKND